MTRLKLSDNEIEYGRKLSTFGSPHNIWGSTAVLPGYTLATGLGTFTAPDVRAGLIKLSLPAPEFITIYCVAPINDDMVAGAAGFPTEEMIGHVQYGVGGYVADADFDWLNGNRITVFAQSLLVTCRRSSLSGACLADPGPFSVSAFACIGQHGTSEATRTIHYLGGGVAPGANAWANPLVIPRMAHEVSVHVPLNPTTIALGLITRTAPAVNGAVLINIPYVDGIKIPNAAKFFNVTNLGAIATPGMFALVFSLKL